jgi:Flp pilus assembly protein TadD
MPSLHSDVKRRFAAFHHNRGLSLERAGRYREAAEAYAEAVRLDPDDADAQIKLGLVLRELGRDEEANLAFLSAIRLRRAFRGH